MEYRSLFAAALLALSLSGPALADDFREGIDDSPSAGTMAFDLLICRPVGIAATVVGVGLFAINFPLSIIMGEPPVEPAKKFIGEPARWTFVRPLGEMD